MPLREFQCLASETISERVHLSDSPVQKKMTPCIPRNVHSCAPSSYVDAVVLPHDVLHLRGCFSPELQREILASADRLASERWNRALVSEVDLLVARAQKGPWVCVYYKWEAHLPSMSSPDGAPVSSEHGESLFDVCAEKLGGTAQLESMPDNAKRHPQSGHRMGRGRPLWPRPGGA